ncbi:MAG: hypothetical protein ACI9Y7_001928 [Dokdonia sp.]|jgi:hypothetical protein
MKSIQKLPLYLAMTSFCFLMIVLGCSKSDTYVTFSNEPDAKMAAYHTDMYVWKKMVRSFQIETESPTNLDWELWSTTEHAYSNPCDSVAWPLDEIDLLDATPKMVAILDGINNSPGNFVTTDFAFLTLNLTTPYYEELRINL